MDSSFWFLQSSQLLSFSSQFYLLGLPLSLKPKWRLLGATIVSAEGASPGNRFFKSCLFHLTSMIWSLGVSSNQIRKSLTLFAMLVYVQKWDCSCCLSAWLLLQIVIHRDDKNSVSKDIKLGSMSFARGLSDEELEWLTEEINRFLLETWSENGDSFVYQLKLVGPVCELLDLCHSHVDLATLSFEWYLFMQRVERFKETE